ncbi:zinc finger protein 836-like [Homalodisca vitripennis]|uniref:zinc finger protein 836-like n=1 Tax=Homalodisca vitripennis TaxID=197043 RepID=UPI001EEAFB69|nr:zinc finger protein 836-like [Homalodisca vitripennis]
MSNNPYNVIQGKPCTVPDSRRNHNDLQISQLVDSGNQNVTNLLIQNSQGPSGNPLLSYQSTSFSGFYGSPGFNTSLSSYDNNLQWLSDNRIPNQHNQITGSLIPDKSINTTSHSLPPTTSHSCCVNRFGMLDSLGISSPLPTEQVSKSTCDVPSFQNKTNLTMNVIDPIQSWLNLQIPSQISSNQQYCKYNERSVTQNYNIPQMNLPLIDQSDLKQNDMCVQSPDVCFENLNANNKHVDSNVNSLKHNSFPMENKSAMLQENIATLKQQGSYQTGLVPKDWKSTFQSMQNYISSPNMFNAVSESQENMIFGQYNIPPSKLYYTPSENYSTYVNKNNACMSQTKSHPNHNENHTIQEPLLDQNNSKVFTSPQTQNSVNNQFHSKHNKEPNKVQQTLGSNANNRTTFNSTLTDCCQINKCSGKVINQVESTRFVLRDSGQERKNSSGNENLSSLNPNENEKNGFKNSEAVSSESDESNIIVEESDDIGEIESEISIEEIKKSYQASKICNSEVLLRCLICNTVTSSLMPANQFIHLNDSFPLTSSRTPVRTKLEQILPMDLQHYIKLHNSFMCRRCLNLIETVEILEVKLKTTKQAINDSFLKTVQQLMPEVDQMLEEGVQIVVQVEHLLQNEKVSKSLPTEDNNKLENSIVEMDQQSVENEYLDDEKVLATSDCETTNDYECSYCNKILSSRKTLDLHLQQHTKEFRYYCERCGKGFPLKSNLEKHLNWHNGSTRDVLMLCEICGEIFTSKHHFNTHHQKNHSGSFNFNCETCGKGFTRKVSLEIHSYKHTGIRPFICEFCGHTFTTEPNLRSHIKVCTKDFSHKCDVCGMIFVLESQLTRHKLQHNGVYKLTCSVCSKGFNKPSDLTYHMFSHSSERQHKCPDCDKTFKTVGNLNYHAKVVHKEELFRCAVCGKSFYQMSLLSEHMTTHANEQPYHCKHCDKNFAHQSTFITHLKTHSSKVKLKTCQVCGKSIKTRMSVHMRTHTGEKPYQCTYCPLAFSVGITLKKHIEAKHCKS